MKTCTTILLLSLCLLGNLTASQLPTPSVDTLHGRYKNYMYIYPRVTAPVCAPSIDRRMKEWYKAHEKEILVDEAQNNLFFKQFKDIASRDNANIIEYPTVSLRRKFGGATYVNSRVALSCTTMNALLMDMKCLHNQLRRAGRISGEFNLMNKAKLDIVKPDAIFINYSHADDYSLLDIPANELPEIEIRKDRFSGEVGLNAINMFLVKAYNRTSLQGRFGKISSKKGERLFTLNMMKDWGIKVFIFNRFYDIPDYIKKHENVTILKDKDDFDNYGWEPHNYTWTNSKGKKITAGFLGTKFAIEKGLRQRYLDHGVLSLWMNDRIYDISLSSLSPESRRRANGMLGGGVWNYITKGPQSENPRI